MKRFIFVLTLCLIAILNACSPEKTSSPESEIKSLTIFFVNDQHGQIDNFSKIKHIIDAERESTNVIVACSGDMFSGNPVVDNAEEEGAPMIDLMNRVGFDVSVVGNHEFDYGQDMLKKRMEQANFEWVCANVDMTGTKVPQPKDYYTVTTGDVKVCFLGLIETYGKNWEIPSTHPKKVDGINFEYYKHIVPAYNDLKTQVNCDLLIALTHIGLNSDKDLAEEYPYFDMIIGGHSHSKAYEKINNTAIFQSGSYLNHLGRIRIDIRNKTAEEIDFELIDLNNYQHSDAELKELINEYNDLPYLKEIIGYSHRYHDRSQVGCFYTDGLRIQLAADVTFQNTGGVRSGLDEGNISRREIYEISPFKNGIVKYEMTVQEIKEFLIGSASGFYYSGISIEQDGQIIIIRDLGGNILADEILLTVGINDFIPTVHDSFFPDNGITQALTAAHTLMAYLENWNNQVDYENCNRYFRYQ